MDSGPANLQDTALPNFGLVLFWFPPLNGHLPFLQLTSNSEVPGTHGGCSMDGLGSDSPVDWDVVAVHTDDGWVSVSLGKDSEPL